MIDSIGIIGFLILLYTVYLILTDGSSKNKNDSNNTSESIEQVQDKSTNNSAQPKEKKNVKAQRIEDSDTDVLTQGKGYSEQEASNIQNMIQQTQNNYAAEPETGTMEVLVTPAPSSKNQESQPSVEMVSVVCPYCDNNMLVPKGGSAECSCCSSIINDKGSVVG